ncbi:MAG TPA: thioredoxin domain-containing protein [Actinomycetota bacterium]|nr:thioredoxin domain-containing protein [Actinomycetota bacterium]
MDRNHEFTVQLPDGSGTFKVALLKDAVVAPEGGSTAATLEWIGAHAHGANEDEALDALLDSLREALSDESNHPRFMEYVRTHGRQLTEEEVAQEEEGQLRQASIRHSVTADEQYQVPIFREARVTRAGSSVVVEAFGARGSGTDLNEAANAFVASLNERVGSADSPGPAFDEFSTWVREHGERIPDEVLRRERETQQAWESSKETIAPISPADIDAESRHGVPLLVDFWAEWCGPCRMIAPVLAQLQDEWGDRIRIRKVNVDEYEGVWDLFNFRGIPAMLLFRDGEEIHRVIGFGGKEALVQELEPHLS